MDEDVRLCNRVRYLPQAAETTLKKLAKLKAEAEQMGLPIQILKDPQALSAAWEREVERARLEAALKGQETSMGIDHAR